MDDQIVPSNRYIEIENPRVREYIQLATQLAPLASQVLELTNNSVALGIQLAHEERDRLQIQEDADERRRIIERRMDHLDAELSADLENNKKVISDSMRAFEWMIQNGFVDAAMVVHERVISMLSGRASIAAEKYNQINLDGQVRFYTTEE